LGLAAWSSTAWCSGFALFQQGTAAMGQGNAFVAEANDPSAIFYNPAGLNQLKRAEVYTQTVFMAPDREYHGVGPVADTNHRLFHSASIYVALPVHSRVALGIGMFNPFGLGTMWSPRWQGRYLTTYSKLATYNVNPVVSVKVMDNLSLAAGFNVLWSAVDLRRALQNPIIPALDGESYLAGSGTGVGYNLGALYEAIPGLNFGVHFRSNIHVKHKGTLYSRLPGAPPFIVAPITGEANLDFPPTVTFGAAYKRIKPFTFLFDVTWTGWSTFDQLRVDLTRPFLGAGTLITPKNWQDAWAFRFGVNYELKPGMKIRAGYIYDMTPVPDSTFDPQLPDSDRHVFSLGSDYQYKWLNLGIAYTFILAEDRTKNNVIRTFPFPAPAQQANGKYSSYVHSLGLSVSIKF
jgi:long-chain fatty acid transport protein